MIWGPPHSTLPVTLFPYTTPVRSYKPADKIVLSVEGGFNLGCGDRGARVGRDSIASINPEYAFDLGVRAGYLVSDNTLLYARGGYENVRASVRLTDAAGTRRDKEIGRAHV